MKTSLWNMVTMGSFSSCARRRRWGWVFGCHVPRRRRAVGLRAGAAGCLDVGLRDTCLLVEVSAYALSQRRESKSFYRELG